MLGDFAFLHLILAAATRGTSTAHAFDIDAKLARGIQHRRADGEAPTFAGRHEQDKRITDFDVHFFTLLKKLSPDLSDCSELG